MIESQEMSMKTLILNIEIYQVLSSVAQLHIREKCGILVELVPIQHRSDNSFYYSQNMFEFLFRVAQLKIVDYKRTIIILCHLTSKVDHAMHIQIQTMLQKKLSISALETRKIKFAERKLKINNIILI